MNRVTIQDIAQAAGVSKSTVSRVLNGTAAVEVEKRKAVLEATQRLGFKPNSIAQSLARGQSMTIGVMTQLIGSPFYDTIAQGVIAGLGGSGYSPIFVDGQWQPESQLESLKALLGRQVDGLVLIGGSLPASQLTEFCGALPKVLVARNLSAEKHHCVYMDNVAGARLATRHLIERGHRRIAMVRGLEHHPDALDRFEGYQQALREADISYDPNLVEAGDFSAESGVRAAENWLARHCECTAVLAANDLAAFGVRLALHRHGRQVPEDISLVGFDDQLEAAYMTPPLTTVRQPAREMGELAARGVIDLIQGKPFKSIAFQGQLVQRESVRRLS